MKKIVHNTVCLLYFILTFAVLYLLADKYGWLVSIRENILKFKGSQAVIENVTPNTVTESGDNLVAIPDLTNHAALSFGVDNGSTTSSSTDSLTDDLIPAPVASKQLLIKETPTGWLNLRQEPKTTAKILTKVQTNDKFEFLEKQTIAGDDYDWYSIETIDGTKGWVYGEYVTEIDN
jgi:uncharacterized protein YgiM (DUF1202 family)